MPSSFFNATSVKCNERSVNELLLTKEIHPPWISYSEFIYFSSSKFRPFLCVILLCLV